MTKLNKCEYKVSRVMAIDRPIRCLNFQEKSERVISVINEATGVNDWIKNSRKQHLVLNRQIYYYCMCVIYKVPLATAAEILYSRKNSQLAKPQDHSTVISGKNAIADILELGNMDYRFKLVNQIIKQIK